MDFQYNYVKPKMTSDKPRYHKLNYKAAELIVNILPDESLMENWEVFKVMDTGTQCGSQISAHEVHTESTNMTSRGMNHKEGGWPKDINPDDEDQKIRFRKKVEKTENFPKVVVQLANVMENCVKQNVAIELCEAYFPTEDTNYENDNLTLMDEELDLDEEVVEESNIKTVTVLKPPGTFNHSVSKISWCSDDRGKLAVAHCNFEFFATLPLEPVHSYIWDMEIPIQPKAEIKPKSPLVCLEYCPKDLNILLGGCYNGQIIIWDQRKGSIPVESSPAEISHSDPVYGALWLQTKGSTECFTTSSDGRMIWWDTRNLKDCVETLILDTDKTVDHVPSLDNACGGTCLEYEPTMPTRFMVGTEEGIVIAGNRKAKGQSSDKITSVYNNGHVGPISSLQRNPVVPKIFLTGGDTSCKIWSEEVRDSPILSFSASTDYVIDSCWMSSRASSFVSVTDAGQLHIWDCIYNTNQPTFSTQICEDTLTSIRIQDNSHHQQSHRGACGTKEGKLYLLEFSSDLTKPLKKSEKSRLTTFFENETIRERIVESRHREFRLQRLQDE